MQYILTEQEFKQGAELLESWREHDIPLEEVYDKSQNLNKQGGLSVQFPTFITIRNDKTEPSYN